MVDYLFFDTSCRTLGFVDRLQGHTDLQNERLKSLYVQVQRPP
jgi:hypothetical protein